METRITRLGCGRVTRVSDLYATGRTACKPLTCEQGLDTPAASRTSEPLLGKLPAG